jgi:predicted DNA-binding transcriptional regulator YafY
VRGGYASKGDEALDTFSRIAASLGGPIERELRKAIGERPADQHRGFLQLREALPSDVERISGVFSFLKEAAEGSARVEFSYTPARGPRAIRRAEPYHVVARSGRYYLIAYDLVRRDWRMFALDAITGPMRKDGTFAPRPVPERFLRERAIGWITGTSRIDMTVRLTSVVAAAVLARMWQPDQRVVRLDDGEVEITLDFDDVDEGVRWALGQGFEALVVAPPEAVSVARRTVERIARRYADASIAGLTELAG